MSRAAPAAHTYTIRRRSGGYVVHLEQSGRTVRAYLVREIMHAWALASAWAN